jgi:hypothetical protein
MTAPREVHRLDGLIELVVAQLVRAIRAGDELAAGNPAPFAHDAAGDVQQSDKQGSADR